MKVAFYIHNRKFQNVDCRNVEKGNPGIGGTWHIFLIVASQLARRDNNIEVSAFVEVLNENLPEGPKYIESETPEKAILLADSLSYDYIILNLNNFEWDNFEYCCLQSQIKLIPWCHNFVHEHIQYLRTFSNQIRVAKVLNVGREQMDLYIDHNVYSKMDYIYNCVPIENDRLLLDSLKPFGKRKHIVTYVGSLVPEKSFHVLASIWPIIKNKIPDAELYVIGSGRLYDEAKKLGKYNLAEKSYETQFMPYLTDKTGNILPNVHFMGNMGVEKNAILAETKVGVPNPTGLTETFCISAVEMQSMGAAVCAMSSAGYYDTIINGNIVRTKKQLAQNIIQLLLSEKAPVSLDNTLDLIKQRFSIDGVLTDWETLFEQGCEEHIHQMLPKINPSFHFKWLKLAIAKSRALSWIPIKNIEYYIYQYERIRRHVRGY